MPAAPSCLCGKCSKCKNRERARLRRAANPRQFREIVCVVCGRLGRSKGGVTCSTRCRQFLAWERNTKSPRAVRKTCEWCGKEMIKPSNRPGRWCSHACKSAAAIGNKINQHGYEMTKVAADDPFISMARGHHKTWYILTHRLVMARHLGRPLGRDEQVHHMNGNKTDNRLENLQLRKGPHGPGVAPRCACCGSQDITYEELAA